MFWFAGHFFLLTFSRRKRYQRYWIATPIIANILTTKLPNATMTKLLFLCFGLSFFQVCSFTVHFAGGVDAPQRRNIATEHRHHQSLARILRLQAKGRSDDPSSSSSEDSKVSEIPQLPAIGASSFDSNQPPASTLPDQDISSNDVSVPVAFVSSKFQIQYTCNVCETRNSHLVSRIGTFHSYTAA
jgi:hypothetical protein